MLMIILLIIGFIFIIAALGIATEAAHSSEERFFIMGLGVVGVVLVLVVLINFDVLYEDASIISKHTDHDKTRVIKENGKTKELYVTIDGDEYHFVFEEYKK